MANRLSSRKWFVKCLALMSVIVGFSIAQQAAASTAADARIQNRVTVTYTGGSDFFDLYVTVTLVSADATVSAPSPATPSIASNGTVDIAFTVTSNANGKDDYSLDFGTHLCDGAAATCDTTFDTATVGITSGQEVTFAVDTISTADGTEVTIAATTYSSGSTANCEGASGAGCTLFVPNDDAADSSLNGFISGAGQKVVAGGQLCSVGVVVDTGPQGDATASNALSTIELFGCAGAVTLSAAEIIGQQVEVVIAFDPSAEGVPTLGSDQTVDLLFSVTGSNAAVVTGTVPVTLTAFTLTVVKYVKNIGSAANSNAGIAGNGSCGVTATHGSATLGDAGSADNDDDFCDTATVVAQPGDQLEYLIVVANGAGSDTNAVRVVDIIPEFVSYETNSVMISTDDSTYNSKTDNATDTDQVDLDTSDPATLYIYGSDPASETTATPGGETAATDLSAGDVLYIIYTVTVD
jgi:uncharacterized repeat protein (TIGR01451 family)